MLATLLTTAPNRTQRSLYYDAPRVVWKALLIRVNKEPAAEPEPGMPAGASYVDFGRGYGNWGWDAPRGAKSDLFNGCSSSVFLGWYLCKIFFSSAPIWRKSLTYRFFSRTAQVCRVRSQGFDRSFYDTTWEYVALHIYAGYGVTGILSAVQELAVRGNYRA